MEAVVVAGVTATRDEAKITLPGHPRQARDPGAGVPAARRRRHRRRRDRAGPRPERPHEPDVHAAGGRRAARAEDCWPSSAPTSVAADQIKTEENLSKVSVVGVGMRSHAGVALKMFEILAKENIHIHLISTTEIKISCVIDAEVRRARRARAARRLRARQRQDLARRVASLPTPYRPGHLEPGAREGSDLRGGSRGARETAGAFAIGSPGGDDEGHARRPRRFHSALAVCRRYAPASRRGGSSTGLRRGSPGRECRSERGEPSRGNAALLRV